MSQNMYGNKSSFQRIGFFQEEVTFAAGALRHEKALIIAKKLRSNLSLSTRHQLWSIEAP